MKPLPLSVSVKEAVPGKREADDINNKLKKAGIYDVQLFYDNGVKPNGMWYVVQIQKAVNNILLPNSYWEGGVRPYIMWLCKTNEGHFRIPNDQDLHDIIAVVTNAKAAWDRGETGDDVADRLDAKVAEKDAKHREKQHQMVKDIAPAMKKAIKAENM